MFFKKKNSSEADNPQQQSNEQSIGKKPWFFGRKNKSASDDVVAENSNTANDSIAEGDTNTNVKPRKKIFSGFVFKKKPQIEQSGPTSTTEEVQKTKFFSFKKKKKDEESTITNSTQTSGNSEQPKKAFTWFSFKKKASEAPKNNGAVEDKKVRKLKFGRFWKKTSDDETAEKEKKHKISFSFLQRRRDMKMLRHEDTKKEGSETTKIRFKGFKNSFKKITSKKPKEQKGQIDESGVAKIAKFGKLKKIFTRRNRDTEQFSASENIQSSTTLDATDINSDEFKQQKEPGKVMLLLRNLRKNKSVPPDSSIGGEKKNIKSLIFKLRKKLAKPTAEVTTIISDNTPIKQKKNILLSQFRKKGDLKDTKKMLPETVSLIVKLEEVAKKQEKRNLFTKRLDTFFQKNDFRKREKFLIANSLKQQENNNVVSSAGFLAKRKKELSKKIATKIKIQKQIEVLEEEVSVVEKKIHHRQRTHHAYRKQALYGNKANVPSIFKGGKLFRNKFIHFSSIFSNNSAKQIPTKKPTHRGGILLKGVRNLLRGIRIKNLFKKKER